MSEIAAGARVWDPVHQHAGVVDRVRDDGVVYYRVAEVGHSRPKGFWSTVKDLVPLQVEALSGSTIMQRMVEDLVSAKATFKVEGSDVYWADADGSTYKVEVSVPGISSDERR